jgi:hypothetical protein
VEYISIDLAEIPYRFEIELAGEVFTFEIHYNHEFDFFTIDLEKNGEVLVYGEKIVYGRPLFSAFSDSRLPKVRIVPKDPSGQATRVGWDELETSVFLIVEPLEDEAG